MLLVSACALGTAGCPTTPSKPTPKPTAAPTVYKDGQPLTALTGTGPAAATSQPQPLIVGLHLYSIEVPIGTASGSEELWSYLDEEPGNARKWANLGLNGFRIGVGRRDSLADVVKVLKRLTGREVKETLLYAPPGDALPVVLKPEQPAQTIFTFFADRTISGSDYPPGDNLINLCCTLDEDEPTKVLITGQPQIQTTNRKLQIVKNDAGAMMVLKPTIYRFDPLTFQIGVARGDFLIIGPGAASKRDNSVGHHFLVKQKNGILFETVLVLVPEVYGGPRRN